MCRLQWCGGAHRCLLACKLVVPVDAGKGEPPLGRGGLCGVSEEVPLPLHLGCRLSSRRPRTSCAAGRVSEPS